VTKIGQDVVTKKFWSPSYRYYFWDGDQIVLIATKGGCHIFLENSRQKLSKGSKKNLLHAPFY
jgi:hypothetical protein